MLQNNIIPELEKYSNFETMIWLLDVASLHCGQTLREYLDEKFAQWIDP